MYKLHFDQKFDEFRSTVESCRVLSVVPLLYKRDDIAKFTILLAF